MKKIKKIAASIMAVAAMATSVTGISASAASGYIYTPYGTMTGSCYNTTWQMANSPVYRKVSATTTITNAVPHIYAEVKAYLNGNQVLHDVDTRTDSTIASAAAMSTQYVNSSLSGGGYHAIWSSSYDRYDYTTHF